MKKLTAEVARALLSRMKENATHSEPTIHEGYTIQALDIALPVLEQHDVDSEALAVSHEIMRIMYDNMIMPAGGSSRLMAQVQCLVIDAMKVAQGDKSLSRQSQASINSHFSPGGYIKEKPKTDEVMAIVDSGWIEWGGGGCPVPDGTRLDIKFRDGDVFFDEDANWVWRHKGMPGDIIAYRVIENDGGAA